MNGGASNAIKHSSWPIVGPTDSVMRLMRGQELTRDSIDADQSRSDVWTVSRDLYLRWQTLTGGPIHPEQAESAGGLAVKRKALARWLRPPR